MDDLEQTKLRLQHIYEMRDLQRELQTVAEKYEVLKARCSKLEDALREYADANNWFYIYNILTYCWKFNGSRKAPREIAQEVLDA